MNLKQRIISFARLNNIDKIGFCDVSPFLHLKKIILKRKENNCLSGFEEQNIEKRINPKITMPNAKSIIVIAESYNKRFEFNKDNKLRGNLSLSAIGLDYHIIVKQKLEKIADFIKAELYYTFEYMSFVDAGPLVDREVAKRAGIGWQGKNCSIITPEFGSWIFIGYMLTNLNLEADTPINLNCENCDICIKSCPTKALKDNYNFCAKNCISFLTQTKEEIEITLKSKMGIQLYGCDICQKVCPYNKNVPFKETIYDIEIAKPELEKIINMSNKEFKAAFGKTAIFWRGKKVIRRNAYIALDNLKSNLI